MAAASSPASTYPGIDVLHMPFGRLYIHRSHLKSQASGSEYSPLCIKLAAVLVLIVIVWLFADTKINRWHSGGDEVSRETHLSTLIQTDSSGAASDGNNGMIVDINEDGVREAFAIRKFKTGDVILRIPLSALYGLRNVSKVLRDVVREQVDEGLIKPLRAPEYLVLGLLYERRYPSSELMRRYVEDLPEISTHFSKFDNVQKELYNAIGHLRSLKMGESVQRLMESIEILRKKHPDLLQPPVTDDEIIHSYFSVTSRYFDLGVDPLGELPPLAGYSIEQPEGAYLIPYVDMVNHHWDAKNFVNTEKHIREGQCVLTATRPISIGDPLRMSYGNWSNFELLGVFGFMLPDNPYGPKLFGIRSRSLKSIECTLQLSRLSLYEKSGYVHEKSIGCLRKLAYDEVSFSQASLSGHFDRLIGITDEIPTRVHENEASWIVKDLKGYAYIETLCSAMERELKSERALRSILELKLRPETDRTSHELIGAWLDHIHQTEACATWWRDAVQGLKTLFMEVEVLPGSRKQYPVNEIIVPSAIPRSKGERIVDEPDEGFEVKKISGINHVEVSSPESSSKEDSPKLMGVDFDNALRIRRIETL